MSFPLLLRRNFCLWCECCSSYVKIASIQKKFVDRRASDFAVCAVVGRAGTSGPGLQATTGTSLRAFCTVVPAAVRRRPAGRPPRRRPAHAGRVAKSGRASLARGHRAWDGPLCSVGERRLGGASGRASRESHLALSAGRRRRPPADRVGVALTTAGRLSRAGRTQLHELAAAEAAELCACSASSVRRRPVRLGASRQPPCRPTRDAAATNAQSPLPHCPTPTRMNPTTEFMSVAAYARFDRCR